MTVQTFTGLVYQTAERQRELEKRVAELEETVNRMIRARSSARVHERLTQEES